MPRKIIAPVIAILGLLLLATSWTWQNEPRIAQKSLEKSAFDIQYFGYGHTTIGPYDELEISKRYDVAHVYTWGIDAPYGMPERFLMSSGSDNVIDQNKKLCSYSYDIRGDSIAEGDVLRIQVNVLNEGYLSGHRTVLVPNPYYGAPPAPPNSDGVLGGSGSPAYDHTRELVEKTKEVVEQRPLECSGKVEAPGFEPTLTEYSLTVPFGESRATSILIEAKTPGNKIIGFYNDQGPADLQFMPVQVEKSHLGLSLEAERLVLSSLQVVGLIAAVAGAIKTVLDILASRRRGGSGTPKKNDERFRRVGHKRR